VAHTFLVTFISSLLSALIWAWWGSYKIRKSREPIPMKLRKGVYVPWGIVQKVQHYGGIVSIIYICIFLTALMFALIYKLFIQ